MKFDKSNASILPQYDKKCEKSSTNAVLKLDKLREVKRWQLLNKKAILVTWEVSKFDTSKDVNTLQS